MKKEKSEFQKFDDVTKQLLSVSYEELQVRQQKYKRGRAETFCLGNYAGRQKLVRDHAQLLVSLRITLPFALHPVPSA